MLNFKSERERADWIVKHADYFTLIEGKCGPRRIKLGDERDIKTLGKAIEIAECLLGNIPGSRWMIYAVAGNSDTYVKTVE